MNVSLASLVGKLNHQTRAAVEAAAGLCLARTHYNVEIEHYLLKSLDFADSDVFFILKHYGIDRSRLSAELTATLDRLKAGNARTPSLSPHFVRMLAEAWSIGSVDYSAAQIRTGHTILALVVDAELSRLVQGTSKEFAKISAEDLRKNFAEITGDSAEESAAAAAPGVQSATARAGTGKQPNLEEYTLDLTERARMGELDPVLGRDFEVRQVIDILTRRRQNNPILVGEAGVGKTAIAEGFAMRIAGGDVPPPLRNVTLRSLDLALLQAGAGIKGEFENRLKGLIEEVRSSANPIILFIDEAHTMIGAGGAAGQGDAANILKPALARGELRTIAATTWSEYKKYFERDPALARRFQLVKVDEPIEDKCLVMIRAIAPALEKHHGVRILDDGIAAAVRLSHRYLPDRQLPDKAVSVLDTACARLALGQNATPPVIEDAQRRLEDLAVQARVLEREMALGIDHAERLARIAERRAATETELAALKERWDRESELVARVRRLRERIESYVEGDGSAYDTTSDGAGETASRQQEIGALRAKLGELFAQLELLQGNAPLVPVTVDAELVSQVISGWTGIPVGKMLRDDAAMALELEKHLEQRIIGQDHALEAISHRIRTAKAGIEDPSKPAGVFLLVGPSGVGKTETALALADVLYGGEQNLITINMSEFQEAHTVSTLKGAPPGYVGYGEGGVLTEAVRRRPYSVVLLDEIEKAHPDVLELFFRVFDKGRMEDGEGRQIDFKNCTIILTTNAATETIMELTADPETIPESEALVRALRPELNNVFRPAFLGRTVVIPFLPVRDEVLKQIVRLKLAKVERRLRETHRVTLLIDEAVIDAIAERCTEVESGARNIDNILTNTLLPALSRLMLSSLVGGAKPTSIRVGIGGAGEFTYSADGAGQTADESAGSAVLT